jgi:hypothetical protein
MVVRWQFFDPVASETYVFALNPNEGGSPSYDKTITQQSTSAPDGKTLLFEGQDQVQTLEWSGAILEQAHHEKYVEWFQKRRQIRVTDDLGRVMWIYITSYKPTRLRTVEKPWRHNFDVSAIILNWETGP